jgi:hypothetical protein
MNAEFAQIDFKISNWTMGPGYADQNGLEQLTRPMSKRRESTGKTSEIGKRSDV